MLRVVPLSLRTTSVDRPRRMARWLGRNWARLTYGRRIEPTWLELTAHRVTVPQLPAAFEGFRIVHLSDLHAGKGVPLTFLGEAVELANRQKPDVVAVTGDFVHKGVRHIDRIAALVGRLSARHGVYAVLGNHDFSVRNALGVRTRRRMHRVIEDALRRHGVTVLRNRSLTLQREGASLHLVGVDDLWSGACDLPRAFAALPPHIPNVLLAHNPRTIERLRGQRCDLVLSGHTHGGQIDWPGVGRFLLSRQGRRFAAGLYRHRNTTLYVNRGIGYGFRFRFGVRPEVAVIHLHRPAASA